MDVTVLILAGGQSSRMGENKALLIIDGKTMIEHVIGFAQSITDQVILVTNSPELYQSYQLRQVADLRKDMGPLAGIEAGLTASTTEINFIVACDMPFVDPEVGRDILGQLGAHDIAVPLIDGQRHPLFAAYRQSTLPILSKMLDRGERKILDFFNLVDVHWLSDLTKERAGLPIFYNMNTPEEYRQAKQKIRGEKNK